MSRIVRDFPTLTYPVMPRARRERLVAAHAPALAAEAVALWKHQRQMRRFDPDLWDVPFTEPR